MRESLDGEIGFQGDVREMKVRAVQEDCILGRGEWGMVEPICVCWGEAKVEWNHRNLITKQDNVNETPGGGLKGDVYREPRNSVPNNHLLNFVEYDP